MTVSRKSQKQARLAATVRMQNGQFPGVEAASLKAIMETEAKRPLKGGDADLSANSLFGDSAKQQSLF